MLNKAYSLAGNWDQMRLGWGLRMRLWALAHYAELHEICGGDEMKVCSCWRLMMLLCCYGMVDCTGCCHDLPLPQWKLQPTTATFQYPVQFTIAIFLQPKVWKGNYWLCWISVAFWIIHFPVFFPRPFFMIMWRWQNRNWNSMWFSRRSRLQEKALTLSDNR